MSAWSIVHTSTFPLSNLLAQAEGSVPSTAAAPAGSTTQPADSSGGAQPFGGLGTIPLMILMFAGMYFFFLRPQNKRAKEHTAFLTNLKPNDRVVLRSGIFGKLISLDGTEAKVEIADRMVIRVYKSQIAGAESQAASVVDNSQGG